MQDSGINLEEEQNALLGNKTGAEVSALPKLQTPVDEETFLNLTPLQVKVRTLHPAFTSNTSNTPFALLLRQDL